MKDENSIGASFKWSAITELLVKLSSPLINAILARILLPEAFAPLASILMIISFCEVFVESGLKKYLIQHEFANDEEYRDAADVVLCASFVIAMFAWLLLSVFSKALALFLGSPEIWKAIIVSGIILPLYAIVGVITAKLQRNLQFKKLFVVRTITAVVPMVITVPLALLGLDYWSLIIGQIAGIGIQMLVLLAVSRYKFRIYFSWNLFHEMFSIGFWSLLDGIAVWLTSWVDSLIIARYMNDYYLGLYKNSLSTVTSLFSMVTASILPVLFVGLSKLQNDKVAFSEFFCKTQRRLALFLIPAGMGIFIYSDFAVKILFGTTWMEAVDVVGITAITIAIRLVFVSICSEAYRARGLFKIPFILQAIDVCLLVPTCMIAAQFGFWALVYGRAIIRFALIIPELILLRRFFEIDALHLLKDMVPIFGGTILMSGVCVVLRFFSDSFLWSICSILVAIVFYFCTIVITPLYRADICSFPMMKKIFNRFKL